MADELDDLRRSVAIACRISAHELQNGTGCLSARIPGAEEMYYSCRDGRGGGLLETNIHQIRRVDFDGQGPDLGTEYAAPNECPLHGELYRARPDVNAVVHVHPFYALLCSIIGVEFRPVFGGYRPAAARIAIRGVPVFHRAATITSQDLARQMIDVMGDQDIVLLRGHGIAATGRTIQEATKLAIEFEELARVMYFVAQSGQPAIDLPAEDVSRYDPAGNASQAMRVGRRQPQELPGADTSGWAGYLLNLERSVGLPS